MPLYNPDVISELGVDAAGTHYYHSWFRDLKITLGEPSTSVVVPFDLLDFSVDGGGGEGGGGDGGGGHRFRAELELCAREMLVGEGPRMLVVLNLANDTAQVHPHRGRRCRLEQMHRGQHRTRHTPVPLDLMLSLLFRPRPKTQAADSTSRAIEVLCNCASQRSRSKTLNLHPAVKSPAVHHALEVATPPSDLFDELGSPQFAILAQHFRAVLWSFGYDSKRLSSETLFEAAGNQLRRDWPD